MASNKSGSTEYEIVVGVILGQHVTVGSFSRRARGCLFCKPITCTNVFIKSVQRHSKVAHCDTALSQKHGIVGCNRNKWKERERDKTITTGASFGCKYVILSFALSKKLVDSGLHLFVLFLPLLVSLRFRFLLFLAWHLSPRELS